LDTPRLDISQITLHEGQKLAYFSREEINQLEFASHYDRILVDFYDFLGKNLELSIG